MKNSPLSIALGAAVPLRIARIRTWGGPSDRDIRTAQAFADQLAERGDRLLFGGGKAGEAAEMFNRLTESIAVLSFTPGGITIFGQHFEGSAA